MAPQGWDSIDVIAERIRALGHRAPGTYAAIARLTSIKEQDGAISAEAMIKELTEGHQAVMVTIRSVLTTAQEARDESTVGVLATLAGGDRRRPPPTPP